MTHLLSKHSLCVANMYNTTIVWVCSMFTVNYQIYYAKIQHGHHNCLISEWKKHASFVFVKFQNLKLASVWLTLDHFPFGQNCTVHLALCHFALSTVLHNKYCRIFAFELRHNISVWSAGRRWFGVSWDSGGVSFSKTVKTLTIGTWIFYIWL